MTEGIWGPIYLEKFGNEVGFFFAAKWRQLEVSFTSAHALQKTGHPPALKLQWLAKT
jgi:hypothetical protein